MPTRPGFLQSKPKIDEAEVAEAQARTVRRLHAFFSPELAAAEAAAEADTRADTAQPAAAVEAARVPPPIVVYEGASEIASIPLPEPIAAATKDVEAPSDDADIAPVGVMAHETSVEATSDDAVPDVEMTRSSDDLGWDFVRPLVGVFGESGPSEFEADSEVEEAPAVDAFPTTAPDVVPAATPVAPKRTPKPRTAKAKTKTAKTAAAKSVAAKPPAPKRAHVPASSGPTVATAVIVKPVVAKPAAPSADHAAAAQHVPMAVAHCPYCATVLDPAPTANRRCERCRHRIMVKKVNGAAVYLTEAALQVFDAERKRVSNFSRWTKERDRWLRLAAAVGAPEDRTAHLGRARLTDDVVAASRKLFVNTADRAFWAARSREDWVAAGRLRREKALALHAGAGSPMSPTPDVVAIFREGVAAELRGISSISRDAELVSVNCCDACRADEGTVVRIARELKAPRLPHAECQRGLCRCRWDLAEKDRLTVRRYLRRRSGSE